ncbi:outer membrane beta-barrel protein [Piscinibacter sp. HJYY11]|uniref:outer membrane beta-barrel protein n=1 Tax=Piscinibacter sp. HJYY11 TaxID=2801333 RepID=UPI0019200622|nr:outer membrane beta-barrel protein [Piscinibacter sp. HJYY11]MBL0728650.1 outer membrane beta-barrel protein [Piscinibacter sp. HJYY11]
MKKKLAVAALALGAAHAAWAQPVVRPLVALGVTGGGDTVARVVYSNGDSDKVRAGGMVALVTGVEMGFTPLVSAQALIGYHVDGITASNGDVKFDRYPVEFLGHYRLTDSFRLGGGARYTARARTRSSGAASGTVPNEDFKPAWGTVVEGEFTVSRNFGIKLRYVSEKFDSKTFPGAPELKGNHVGVYFVGYFF